MNQNSALVNKEINEPLSNLIKILARAAVDEYLKEQRKLKELTQDQE